MRTRKSSPANRKQRTICGEVLADALDTKAAADTLGVSPATIHRMVFGGHLAAVRLGGVWRLPAWQFSAHGMLPGVRILLESWRGSFVSLSIWACTPSPPLGGRTPAQALRESGQIAATRHTSAPSVTRAEPQPESGGTPTVIRVARERERRSARRVCEHRRRATPERRNGRDA